MSTGSVTAVLPRYWTVAEFAELIHVSVEKARLMIRNEPGVLRLPSTTAASLAGRKRGKVGYRIPDEVVQRIIRRLSNPTR